MTDNPIPFQQKMWHSLPVIYIYIVSTKHHQHQIYQAARSIRSLTRRLLRTQVAKKGCNSSGRVCMPSKMAQLQMLDTLRDYLLPCPLYMCIIYNKHIISVYIYIYQTVIGPSNKINKEFWETKETTLYNGRHYAGPRLIWVQQFTNLGKAGQDSILYLESR